MQESYLNVAMHLFRKLVSVFIYHVKCSCHKVIRTWGSGLKEQDSGVTISLRREFVSTFHSLKLLGPSQLGLKPQLKHSTSNFHSVPMYFHVTPKQMQMKPHDMHNLLSHSNSPYNNYQSFPLQLLNIHQSS